MNTNSTTFQANFNSGFAPLVDLGVRFANWFKRHFLTSKEKGEVQGDLFGASA
ncbi:MAG: hypothetical protein AB7O70_10175 [Hyphomicrobiales bacterium]